MKTLPGRFSAIIVFTFVVIFFADAVFCSEKVLKTSHKRYTVYPYKDLHILCEPYLVAKNDWLYKIFRKKGEISEDDFPLFLTIFKSFNPEVSNIDAIQPGQTILIPLKRINADEYQETEPGVVDVPVIEFTSIPEVIKPFISPHEIKKGESVSELIDSVFINKDGSLNEKGQKAFKIANPAINDVDLIYTGTFINLPSREIASQPWFLSLFSGTDTNAGPQFQPLPGPPVDLDDQTLQKLIEDYSTMIGGNLLNDGKVYFPREEQNDIALDLSIMPVIELDNGERLLVVPPDQTDSILIETIKLFWPKMTLLDIQNIMQSVSTRQNTDISNETPGTPTVLPSGHAATIEKLLKTMAFTYSKTSTVSFSLGRIRVEALVGRIKRADHPDLLLDFGDIYGNALDAIKAEGIDILSIAPEEDTLEVISKLFTALGYTVVQDPGFVSTQTQKTIVIPGLFITGSSIELFISNQILDSQTTSFLDEKGILVYYTQTAELYSKNRI